MPTLNYQQNLTGVQVPRSEVLNARPWAIMKLIGFIIASLVVATALMLSGALLTGARMRVNFSHPAPANATAPAVPAQQATTLHPTAAPATPPAPTQISVSVPEIRVVLPPQNRQEPGRRLLTPEELEQAYKEKLLEEGADP